ncbi:unnamed protein product, partial [Meganyctiphanes norvegica]
GRVCPEGFIRSQDKRQCFKIFNDKEYSRNEAQAKCEEENLVLAVPSKAVVLALRDDLLDNYGDLEWLWLDGITPVASSSVMVKNNQTEMNINKDLWMPGEPSLFYDKNTCLGMYIIEQVVTGFPGQVYSTFPCWAGGSILCEDIVE